MKKILLSFLAAAFIAVAIPLIIIKCFSPNENADSTEPVPAATEMT